MAQNAITKLLNTSTLSNKFFRVVIANRSDGEGRAIQNCILKTLDCFATLAMTKRLIIGKNLFDGVLGFIFNFMLKYSFNSFLVWVS